MNDFTQKTNKRQFELVFEDGMVLFVNGHYLAELSPYFDMLCFGNCVESREQRAFIKDEKWDEMVVVLNYLCPFDGMLEKRIRMCDYAILMHYAYRMIFPQLQQELKVFCREKFPQLTKLEPVCDSLIIDIIIEAAVSGLTPSDIWQICEPFGGKGEQYVKEVIKDFDKDLQEIVIKYTRGHEMA
uniref:BTB domain-containing protein n=1 Tax=Rhabditophanes sp. KR3021 TaxID=114890 RepID=A0AC35TGM9_9BILA